MGLIFDAFFISFQLTLIAFQYIQGRPDGRIVGGVEATPGEFPSFATVEFGPYICGGVIVSTEWIVTAAHCMVFPIDVYIVTAGEHDVRVIEGTEQVRKAVRIVSHPLFNEPFHDIALIKVSPPLTVTPFVAPATLPARGSQLPPNSPLVAAGFGGTAIDGTMPSPILRKVTLPLFDISACNVTWEGWIGPGNLCAGGVDGMDTCPGDSGGPLYSGGTLVGLTSWGGDITQPCGLPDVPAIYTNVTYYVDWVAAIFTPKVPCPCRSEGYFEIMAGDKARFCPIARINCDYVQCAWYPSLDRFIRVFYTCPGDEDINGLKDEYRFDGQKCVKRVS